ncbi:MAG: hypothetical protein EBY21_00200 [Alphaproteobacteria bacterium]|jgi:hypothetical protein|nr:hypothetical protein [Alphaproteobacteria bacterium]
MAISYTKRIIKRQNRLANLRFLRSAEKLCIQSAFGAICLIFNPAQNVLILQNNFPRAKIEGKE